MRRGQRVALFIRAAKRQVRRSLGWLKAHVTQVAAVAAVIIPVVIWADQAKDSRELIEIVDRIEENTRKSATLASSPSSGGSSGEVQDIVEGAGDQLRNVGDLVDLAAFHGSPTINFKNHVDNPSPNELRKAVGPEVVGIGLLAFPASAAYFDGQPAYRATF